MFYLNIRPYIIQYSLSTLPYLALINFRHITAYPNLRMSTNFLIENDFVHKNTDMWTRTTIKIIKFSMEEKNTNENM